MIQLKRIWSWSGFLAGASFLFCGLAIGNSPTPVLPSPSAPAAPAANSSPAHPTAKPKKITVSRRVVSKLSSATTQTANDSTKTLVGANNSQRAAFEEAKNLIVAGQPYLIKFEDEENYGKVSESGQTHIELTFSPDEVSQYQKAVETVGLYRNQLRSRCTGNSPKIFIQGLDKYLHSLSVFNRKALPMVADISEANPSMVLVVNRNVLIDAPVLMSRYLQFKRQRFKEAMNKFVTSDKEFIDSLVTIAKTLRVNVSEADWNKSYGVRENGLEMISMWPRETIFEATERLADAKETVCIVDLTAVRPVQQAQKEKDKEAAPKSGTGE